MPLRHGPGPRIGSAYPLPVPHQFLPEAAALSARHLQAFVALLVPAYAAADLIQRGALRRLPAGLPRAPGRAHDPDGAFSLPHLTTLTALVARGTPPASLDEAWRADALWPAVPRLLISAARLRRGFPLNDAHTGHWRTIAQDLLDLRPRLSPDPLRELRAGRADLAIVPLPAASPGRAPHLELEAADLQAVIPAEGAALVEYDWILPAGGDVVAAQDFLAALQYRLPPTSFGSPRLLPPTPLTAPSLQAQMAVWDQLNADGFDGRL